MLLPLVSLTAVLTVGGGLPTAAPREVGMSAARLETVDRVVRRGVLSGAYPGAAVVVGLLVGGDAGAAVAIGGGVVGLIGLYRYLQ